MASATYRRLAWCVLPAALVLGRVELFAAERLARIAQTQTAAACMTNCDTLVATCQNACALSSTSPPAAPPTPATPAPAGPPVPMLSNQCLTGCTNQQLACKQTCSALPE
jgi:hypothetical protein